MMVDGPMMVYSTVNLLIKGGIRILNRKPQVVVLGSFVRLVKERTTQGEFGKGVLM